MNELSLVLAKNHANNVALGITDPRVEGTTVYFTIVETGEEVSVTLPTPKDGVSVVDVTMDADHQLFFVLSDGSQIAAGKVDTIKGDKGEQGDKGERGDAGYSPTIIENADNTTDIYKLDITDATGTFTTPNLKGRQGAQGIQGPRGETGEKGDIGLTGEAGFSPVITENSDNSDTVYKLDITDANGTFTTQNLVGKQGPQGLQGDQGIKGDQGIQGPAGVSPTLVENIDNTDEIYKLDITDANGTFTTPNLFGRQGPQGIQGEVGPQGEQGIQGIQGIQGPKGNDGYPFLIYKEYASLDEFDPAHFPEIGLMFMVRDGSTENVPVYRYTGDSTNPYSHTTDMATAEGLKGDKGDKGDQGEQGIQGEKGADGITYTPVIGTITTASSDTDAAADVVVDNEAKTATFNFSIPRGPQGIQGPQGEQGIQGEKGVDGSTYTPTIGTVTTVNAASEASADIVVDSENKIAQFNFSIPRGSQGLQGLQGPQGEPGETGADGADGTTYIPSIGTVSTVDSFAEASAEVSLNEETKEAVFNFNIPKGASGEKAVQFTPIITENGELAWENDGDLENPPTTPIQQIYANTPIGTVLSFAGSKAPNGYLLCDGKSYAVADYEDLYAVIGNTYGGDSTNFNVPNLIDKFIQGSNTSGTEKEAGLPNIKGIWVGNDKTSPYLTGTMTGAFSRGEGTGKKIYGTNTSSGDNVFVFDASKSNAIYGNSDTVQPPALTMVYIIKAFHTNEGTDSGVSDDVINYVDNKVDELISDTDLNSTTTTWSSSKISSETAKKKQVMELPHTISNNKFIVTYSDVAALIDKYCNFANSGVKQNAYVPFYLTCYTSNNNTVLSCFARFEGGIYLDKVVYSSNDSPAEITRESDVNFISIELGGTPTSLFVTI